VEQSDHEAIAQQAAAKAAEAYQQKLRDEKEFSE